MSNELSNELSGNIIYNIYNITLNYSVYKFNLFYILVVANSKMQRVTVESLSCLRFWFNNGKLISGCTTSIDPDGGESGKEWC